jgi:hypothetical protein
MPRGEVAEIEARGPLPLSGKVDENALYRLPFGENSFRLPQGENLPDGTYRISDLGPGTWQIEAEIHTTSVKKKREVRRGRSPVLRDLKKRRQRRRKEEGKTSFPSSNGSYPQIWRISGGKIVIPASTAHIQGENDLPFRYGADPEGESLSLFLTAHRGRENHYP